MILYKKQPINFEHQSVMVLEVENGGGYIYLSRHVYDQVLLLNDRFESDMSVLKRVLGVNATHHEAVSYFNTAAPKPISILAPFIALIRPDIAMKKDLEMLCGVLHQMSKLIDFNSFTKVPAEVRANVEFTRNEIMNYEQSWDDLLLKISTKDIDLEFVKLDVVKELIKELFDGLSLPVMQSNYSQPVAQQVQYIERVAQQEEIEEEEEEEDGPSIWDLLSAEMAANLGAVDQSVVDKQTTEAESEKEQPKEETEGDKELSDIDMIIKAMSGGN